MPDFPADSCESVGAPLQFGYAFGIGLTFSNSTSALPGPFIGLVPVAAQRHREAHCLPS
jgi:hypothetical protein